jgi:PEP-CTERM motif
MTVRRSLVVCALLIAGLLHAGAASAVSVIVGLEGGTPWELTNPANASSTVSAPDPTTGAVTWSLTAPFVKNSYRVDAMSAQLKEDPFVTNNITLTNTTLNTQTFVVTVLLPVPAFNYNATIGSSIGVTVTDSNNSGAVTASSVASTGIYQGLVNGSTIITMMPHTTTVSCAASGCSNTLNDNFFVPQYAAGPGTANTIGITLRFSLTSFDSIGITSRFEIINVPEPTTLALLGAGLVALGLARKRAH